AGRRRCLPRLPCLRLRSWGFARLDLEGRRFRRRWRNGIVCLGIRRRYRRGGGLGLRSGLGLGWRRRGGLGGGALGLTGFRGDQQAGHAVHVLAFVYGLGGGGKVLLSRARLVRFLGLNTPKLGLQLLFVVRVFLAAVGRKYENARAAVLALPQVAGRHAGAGGAVENADRWASAAARVEERGGGDAVAILRIGIMHDLLHALINAGHHVAHLLI